MAKPTLTDEDFERAARRLRCDVPAIKAVAQVESRGAGFLPSGEPKILFEAHIFDRLTAGRFRRSHPRLSSPKWDKSLYAGSGAGEHKRLQAAVELDRDAALQSASWGAWQVMGFNWALCGYPSLQAFVNEMYDGEPGQLRAFVGFVKGRGLADELRRLDWHGFARAYNGPAHAKNSYAEKMADAYARHVKLNPDFSRVNSAVTSTESPR